MIFPIPTASADQSRALSVTPAVLIGLPALVLTGICTIAFAADTAIPPTMAKLYQPPPEVRLAPPAFLPLTGPRLQQQLDAPLLQASFTAIPLRTVLRELEDVHRVSILCDSRVDPSQRITVSGGENLRQFLERIAHDAKSDVGLFGQAVLFGPEGSIRAASALVETRRWELEAPPASSDLQVERPQQVKLLAARTIRWGDLTPPAELVDLIGREFGFTCENRQLIIPDLWAGAVLPEMNAAECLTLVLMQQNLTFRWQRGGAAISLEPLPSDRSQWVLERSYSLPPDLSVAWKRRLPPDAVRALGSRLLVRATLAEHEMLQEELSASSASRRTPSGIDSKTADAKSEAIPLSRRQFTLSVKQVPIQAVMNKLQESGITFTYDAEKFSRAGIDFSTPVTIDVRQVTADRFLQQLFEPLPVTIEIRGATVILDPRQ